MHPYPHRYSVSAAATAAGPVTVSAAGLADISTAPPAQFDGPGDLWSPESLLCAALADCFLLTFRAVARASKFDWQSLSCSVEGLLERSDGQSRFTRFTTHAVLQVAPGSDVQKAQALLEKSERGCLIANSVSGERHLEAQVRVAADAPA